MLSAEELSSRISHPSCIPGTASLMDDVYLYLFNADSDTNDERLEFMRSNVNQSFAHVKESVRKFSGTLEDKPLDKPALVFAHKSPWSTRGGIESAFKEWKADNWQLLYLVVYSGADRLSQEAVSQIKTAAEQCEVGEHVYVIERKFPERIDSEKLRSFVDAFVDHYSTVEADRPDDSDLHDTLAEAMDRVNMETRVDFLSALSILCQGYLSVHSDTEAAQSALNQMDWSDDLMPKDVDPEVKRDEATDPRWWQVFNGDLKKQAKEEWDQDSMEGWQKVSDLIERISSGEDPGPETVATAYCKLAKRLGGEPCP